MRNICRHLYMGGLDGIEVVMLVTRPEWIRLQLTRNGILQYERDVSYGIKWIKERGEDEDMEVKKLEIVRDAVRLATSYIMLREDEVWFQLYGRLLRCGNISGGIKRLLKYIERNTPRPWLKPIGRSDGLMTEAGNRARGLVDVGDPIRCMVILSGDREVVCGCESGELVIVNLKESVVKRRWDGHSGPVCDLKTAEEGKFVISVSRDGLGKIWNAGNCCLVKTLKGHSDGVDFVRISRDEKRVYTGSWYESIRIWDFDTGRCTHILRTDRQFLDSFAVVIVNGRECIVTADRRNAVVWEVENEVEMEIVTGHDYKDKDLHEHCKVSEVLMHSDVKCVALNSNEPTMVTGHSDGSTQLWDAKNMRPIGEPWNTHSSLVVCTALSNCSSRVTSGDMDGTIQVRDVNTGHLICEPFIGHSAAVTTTSFMEQDESIVSCSMDGTVREWRTEQFSEVVCDDNVWCVRCSPDESCYITGHKDGQNGEVEPF